MKVTPGAPSPLIPTAPSRLQRTRLALVGLGFGLFAVAALAAALWLEGPGSAPETSTTLQKH